MATGLEAFKCYRVVTARVHCVGVVRSVPRQSNWRHGESGYLVCITVAPSGDLELIPARFAACYGYVAGVATLILDGDVNVVQVHAAAPVLTVVVDVVDAVRDKVCD